MIEPLTTNEENLLKDLLREMDQHPAVINQLAQKLHVAPRDIENQFDGIWKKLQNGRLTVVES